jgi:uncharacterized membrane protein (UPF0127 family)
MPQSLHLLRIFLTAALCLVFSGLRAETLPTAELRIGKAALTVEIARTAEQSARGLMHRHSLPANQGMLFIFPEERQAHFWMANTLLPLSIAYLDRKGKILEIQNLVPLDKTIRSSKATNVLYAIEVNQGWFRLNELKPGDLVEPVNTSWEKLNKN